MILAHTGHLKVIDFGIAKAQSRALHTESGQVKGKLGYMSPEAALGLPIGPASDVFSAGVVAWELITASPLFSAKSDFETMRRIREAEIVPPSRHNPACPPALDAVVLAALQRDVERRLPSAAAFRQQLELLAQQMQIQVSARTVGEWMQQVPGPDGRTRRPSAWSQPGMPGHPAQPSNPSGLKLQMPLPPEPLTTNLRISGRTALTRSHEEAQLATEIWGDDARTSSNSPGPNFSATTPPPVQAYEPPIPHAMPMQYAQPAPTPAPIPTAQMRAQHVPPEEPPRRKVLVYALAVAIMITLGAVIGVLYTSPDRVAKSDPAPTPTATATATVPDPPPSAGTALPSPSPSPSPSPLPGPVAVTTAHDHPVPTAHPTHHDHPTGHNLAANPPDAHVDPTPIAETPPPHVDPTPTPVPTPLPTPPTVPPPPPTVTPKLPTRTPVVAASSVTKLSGELPQLQVHGSDTNGDVLAKICIDEQGHVSSAKVLKSPAEITGDLQHALEGWRYKPYAKDGVTSAVCFALSLRVVVKHAD